MADENLQRLFSSSKFEEATAILKENPESFGTINKYSLSQVYSSLLKNNQFEIIDILIENQIIVTDLYQYDSILNSIFAVLFKDLNENQESLLFLENFLQKLKNREDSIKNETLIHIAISQNANPIFIKKLIEAGCPANYKNNAEENYLHYSISKNGLKNDQLLAYVNLFLEEGVDANAENLVKKTPLYYAVENNKIEVVETLINNGAQANHQNKEGESVFYHCIVNKRNYEMLVKLCEFESIDFEKVTNQKATILFSFLKNASESELKTFDSLLDQNPDFFQESLFYSMRTPFDLLPGIPFTFFEKAIETGKISTEDVDNDNNTLLHKVCAYELNNDQNKARELYKKVTFLLSKNADTNATNNNDKTPMQLALTDNLKDKIVALLLNSKSE